MNGLTVNKQCILPSFFIDFLSFIQPFRQTTLLQKVTDIKQHLQEIKSKINGGNFEQH
jgi:hypothetical protein